MISLAQKQEERKKEHAIGFKVYRCQKGETNLSESFMRNNNSVRTFFCIFILQRATQTIFSYVLSFSVQGQSRKECIEVKIVRQTVLEKSISSQVFNFFKNKK